MASCFLSGRFFAFKQWTGADCNRSIFKNGREPSFVKDGNAELAGFIKL